MIHFRRRFPGFVASTAFLAVLAGVVFSSRWAHSFWDYYGDRSPEQVANVFRAKFTQSLFQLQPGAWQGPLESGLGWHLVWVDSLTPARVPAFEAVEKDARSEWVAEQRAEFKRRAFAAMQAHYEIVLPDSMAREPAGSSTSPALGAW